MGKYRWPRWRNVWCIFNLVLTCKGTSLPKIWTYVSLWMLAGGTVHINPWTGVNEHPGKLQWDKLCRNTSTSFPSYLSSSQSWICHGSIKLVFCQGSCWPKTLNPPSPSSNYKNLAELGRCDRKQHLGWVIFDSLLKYKKNMLSWTFCMKGDLWWALGGPSWWMGTFWGPRGSRDTSGVHLGGPMWSGGTVWGPGGFIRDV